MTTVTKFDRKNCKLIQDEAAAALQAVAAKYGLAVTQHGGTLGDLQFVAKFAFKVTDQKAVADTAKAEWDSSCHYFSGLRPEDFGAEISWGGRKFVITGLMLSRSKKPIKVRDTGNGKDYVFADKDVARLLGRGVTLQDRFELIKQA
jgi:hypothetical protein